MVLNLGASISPQTMALRRASRRGRRSRLLRAAFRGVLAMGSGTGAGAVSGRECCPSDSAAAAVTEAMSALARGAAFAADTDGCVRPVQVVVNSDIRLNLCSKSGNDCPVHFSACLCNWRMARRGGVKVRAGFGPEAPSAERFFFFRVSLIPPHTEIITTAQGIISSIICDQSTIFRNFAQI